MITTMRRTLQSLITLLPLITLITLPVSAQTKSTEVLFETTAGNIRIALYDETPQTRDNFLKITKMGIYDSLLIHRVIKDFMIQSGDTNSKHAKPGQLRKGARRPVSSISSGVKFSKTSNSRRSRRNLTQPPKAA